MPGQGISWVRVILGGMLGLAIATVLLALVGPLVAIRIYGGSSYQIVDNAMSPALLTGDWVLAEPLEPGAVPPRGTIVAYDHPKIRDMSMVMRVIGLPGETVQMRGGAVYIDGQRAGMEMLDDHVIANRPPARRAPWPQCVNKPVEIDGKCHQELWRETLPGGATALVLNTHGKIGLAAFGGNKGGAKYGDDAPLVNVPGDAVFVMGDNRDASVDSRDPAHGVVPLRHLRHKVWMIHSSLDKSSRFFHPRWDRFFRKVE